MATQGRVAKIPFHSPFTMKTMDFSTLSAGKAPRLAALCGSSSDHGVPVGGVRGATPRIIATVWLGLLPGLALHAQSGAVPESRLPGDHGTVSVEGWQGDVRSPSPSPFLLGVRHAGDDGNPSYLATLVDPEGTAPPVLPGDSVVLVWSPWPGPGEPRVVHTSVARTVAVDRVNAGRDFIWGVIMGSGWVAALEVQGDAPGDQKFQVLTDPRWQISSGPRGVVPQEVADALRQRQDSILRERRTESRAEPRAPWNAHHESYFAAMEERHAALVPDAEGHVTDVFLLEGPEGPVWVSSLYAVNNPDDKKGFASFLVRVMDARGQMHFEREADPGVAIGVVRKGREGEEALLFGRTILWHDGEAWRLAPVQEGPFVT